MKVTKAQENSSKIYYLTDDEHEIEYSKIYKEFWCNTCNSTTCQHCTAVRVYLRHESRV